MMFPRLSLFVLMLCPLPMSAAASEPVQPADDVDSYTAQLKPLFRKRCYACHGALKQEAGLRLDTVAAMHEQGVIDLDSPAKSPLLERIATDDLELRMPPEHEGEPFSAAEIQSLRNWLTAGAFAPVGETPETDPQDHWAFRPLARPAVPQFQPVPANRWVIRNPIDAFVAEQHRAHDLTPQVSASRRLLIRRLTLDLIGVPPTLQEINEFVEADEVDAYEILVDRLLDDPRHGQRWARHWMDVWRYSDWWGLGEQLRNSQKHIWHWRDWIVTSLNEDLPYDEMIRLMLAADEIHPNDLDKLRASGYLARNFNLFNRNQWLEETVEHVGKAFLGLTFNCAKCHDHKYDPIEQSDFYRLRAFFEPYHVRHDMVPGHTDLNADGIPRPFDALLDAPTYRLVRGEEGNADTSVVIEPGVPEIFKFAELTIESQSLPAEAWQPARRPWVLAAYQQSAEVKLEQAIAARDTLLAKAKSADSANTAESAPQTDDPAIDVAERAVAVAEAELASLLARAAAMRAAWQQQDETSTERATATPSEANASASNAAITAERKLQLANAEHAAAIARQRLQTAADDQRAAAEEALQKAQQAVSQASEKLNSPITATDSFTPLSGAGWAPTRFKFSGSDDPRIEFPATSTGRRTALAKWLTDARNPLTARVAVNHIWARHMGQPLVSSMFDFGRNGAKPTHPELLDWLAVELIESGWSMKHLHRLITNSSTYRLHASTLGQAENLRRDPENRFLWRRLPTRLESQVVRDSVLAISGQLDCSFGGPPIPNSQQATSNRRSLYFFHSKNERNLFLTTFDEARVTDCYRRETSIVPQQALAMSNSQLVLDAAPKIAARISQQVEAREPFVRAAWLTLLGIAASPAEIEASLTALAAWEAQPDCDEPTARGYFIWSLLNHNDFVTVR
ncbi:PSD1 and planctomycete cytochrome C domain-containing protein [Planctomycetaceae bacterium SH139]